jgi:beta-glucanase (GH16 family)
MKMVLVFSVSAIFVLLLAISFDTRLFYLPIQLPADALSRRALVWVQGGAARGEPGTSLDIPDEKAGQLDAAEVDGLISPPTGSRFHFPSAFHPYRCGWSTTFFDDFNGDWLDNSKWRSDYPAGDRERQHYTADSFEVQDGLLKIKADRRQVDDREYSSGIITTQSLFDQQYGRFEIRAKMPSGKGMWPAYWLLPTSKNYPFELDVLEVLGHETDTVHMSHHWRAADGSTQDKTRSFSGPDFSEGFHTFSLEWSADALIWRVDGIERARATHGIPHEPMFLLVNLAVGGAWPGDPDAITRFPGYYEVDYVRVSSWFCD